MACTHRDAAVEAQEPESLSTILLDYLSCVPALNTVPCDGMSLSSWESCWLGACSSVNSSHFWLVPTGHLLSRHRACRRSKSSPSSTPSRWTRTTRVRTLSTYSASTPPPPRNGWPRRHGISTKRTHHCRWAFTRLAMRSISLLSRRQDVGRAGVGYTRDPQPKREWPEF